MPAVPVPANRGTRKGSTTENNTENAATSEINSMIDSTEQTDAGSTSTGKGSTEKAGTSKGSAEKAGISKGSNEKATTSIVTIRVACSKRYDGHGRARVRVSAVMKVVSGINRRPPRFHSLYNDRSLCGAYRAILLGGSSCLDIDGKGGRMMGAPHHQREGRFATHTLSEANLAVFAIQIFVPWCRCHHNHEISTHLGEEMCCELDHVGITQEQDENES